MGLYFHLNADYRRTKLFYSRPLSEKRRHENNLQGHIVLQEQ